MFKKFTFIFFLFSAVSLNAGDYFGVGIRMGLQNDVGNLASLYRADYEPQQNILIGAMLEIDVRMFFIRTGADTSFNIYKGKIKNSSAGKLEIINVQYTSIPAFIGLNLRIRDSGKLYVGFGGAFIIGRGDVTTSAKKYTNSENVFGLGFLLGLQLRAGSNVRVYAEWEYLSAKSKPVINIDATNSFDDFSIDYSGSRFHLGISYYIL